MSKKIDLLFEDQMGKQVTISVDHPVEPVDAQLVQSVMETILAEDVFLASGGKLTAIKGARLVQHEVTAIPLGI